MPILGSVDPAPRLKVLAALDAIQWRSASEIGRLIGRSNAATRQMLDALLADRLVETQTHDRFVLWRRTARQVPARFASTSRSSNPDQGRYQTDALLCAMGLCQNPPATPPHARVIRFGQ